MAFQGIRTEKDRIFRICARTPDLFNMMINFSNEESLIIVKIGDLKEIFLSWAEEWRKAHEVQKEERLFSANEASTLLQVDRATLWRWEKSGYLPAVRRGSRVFYRDTDIKNLTK